MKELMKKGIEMFSFGKIAEIEQIENRFSIIHERGLKKHPHWSAASTRHLLINDYWFAVIKHFVVLMLPPMVIFMVYNRAFNIPILIVVLSLSLLVFCSLYFALYRTTYTLHYLPHLETVTSKYKNDQHQIMINELQIKLIEQQNEAATRLQLFQEQERQEREAYQKRLIEREKKLANMEQMLAGENECRKTQLRTFTLVLIFHTIHKTLLHSNLKSDPETTVILNQLFGRDADSFREPIEIINGISTKRDKVKMRRATEIHNRFDEAREFFKSINYGDAIGVLDKLEEKIFSTPPTK